MPAAALPLVRNRRGEYDLWQRRFWEHMIRDECEFARHVEYNHHNPVKQGLVTNPFAWRWYVRRGIIAADWSGRDQAGMLGD